MKILVLNGPNLNLVGRREPAVYGAVALDDYLGRLAAELAPRCELVALQSNHEGALLDRLHAAGYGGADEAADGVVANFGALTHTSHALGDAVRAVDVPVVEVHISNVYARERFRHRSLTAPGAAGVIAGLGLEGYRLAAEYLLRAAQA